MAKFNAKLAYKNLFQTYGPQKWWPVLHPQNAQFEISIGAILTQNTAWTNVEKALTNLYKNNLLLLEAIKTAPKSKLAKAIKPAGYFNQKAIKLKKFVKFLEAEGGFKKLAKLQVPELRKKLLGIWGIGPETADSIILYAFNKPSFVIDTYTKRLLAKSGIKFKTYDEYKKYFESRLPKNVKMWNEYHALIVRWGKGHAGRKGIKKPLGISH